MKSFKNHASEGTFTSGMIKSLGFMLRNKLSQKIKSGKASKDLSQKLDALLDAQGIIGSIGIMNIGGRRRTVLDVPFNYHSWTHQ